MKKFNKVLSMILGTAMVLSLAACGAKEQPAASSQAPAASSEVAPAASSEAAPEVVEKTIEPCTITFWHAMNNKQEETLVAITDEFNKTNEFGITVELVNQGKYADLQSKVDAAVLAAKGGDATALPDLSQVYNNWCSDYVDMIVSLDQFIDDEYNWSDIVPAFAQECASFGDIKVIPFNKSTYVFFYNKTLFDELGIEAPKTWEDVAAAAKVVKEKKNIPFIGFDDMTGAVDCVVLQNKGETNEVGYLQYDSAEGTEAIDWLLNLYKEGYATLVGDDQYFSNKLSAGNVAGYIGSSTGWTYITADGWDLAAAPVFSGKGAYAYQAGTNVAMFSADENKQLAAWEYEKYLTSVEATVQWATATGYLPVRVSAYQTPEYQALLNGDDTAAAVAKAAAEQAANYNGVYGGCYKGANDIRTIIGKQFPVYIQEAYSTENAIKALMDEIEYAVQ